MPLSRLARKDLPHPWLQIGVTIHKRTGFEAHIWMKNPRGKGFQRHLGTYQAAEDAARCYDRAALHTRGEGAELNFPRSDYSQARLPTPRGRGRRFVKPASTPMAAADRQPGAGVLPLPAAHPAHLLTPLPS